MISDEPRGTGEAYVESKTAIVGEKVWNGWGEGKGGTMGSLRS